MPRALILTADGFEDLEVMVPKIRLEEIGWTVDVAAPEEGTVYGEHDYDVDARFDYDSVHTEDYQLLILPGGPPGGGAETVRSYRAARRIAREFLDGGKTVAAICHGPWTLVSADALDGRRLTSVKSDGVPDEIEDQGAEWVDEEVVVDGNLITSRTPEDLAAFCREIVKAVGDASGSSGAKSSSKAHDEEKPNGVVKNGRAKRTETAKAV